jgi:hypothetical protein
MASTPPSTKSDEICIGHFVCVGLTQRQRSIMERIHEFFTDHIIQDLLVPLIQQTNGISLRALDWLVTNYSKKHNIVCRGAHLNLFNIYHGYKVALSHFRRRNFDPFRRRNRIRVVIDGADVCETTVGQCNFLYWAYVNGVLDYATQHSKDIETDMNSASAMHKAERRMQKANGVPHRRRELSSAPRSKCSVYQVATTVTFDCVASD